MNENEILTSTAVDVEVTGVAAVTESPRHATVKAKHVPPVTDATERSRRVPAVITWSNGDEDYQKTKSGKDANTWVPAPGTGHEIRL